MASVSKRFGLIGAGLIGKKRSGALAELGFEMAGVFDIDESRASTLAHSFGSVAKSTIQELISSVGKDGVIVVATPHCELTKAAMAVVESNVNLLLEKPGAMSLEDVTSLIDFIAHCGSDSKIAVGFNHRFHPGILAMREAIFSRRYGQVKFIRAVYGHGGRLGYEREWRFDPAISGGGELLDQGSHLIDLVRFLTGEDLLYKFSSISNIFWGGKVEDNAILNLVGSNSGFEALLHASWTEWKNKFLLEVFCESAKVEVSGLGGSYGAETFRIYDMGEKLGPPQISSVEFKPDDLSWKREIVDFIGAIEGNESIGATVFDSRAVFEIVQRSYEA
ncbi:Gfo/Idh/MocA family oxidoreductase [Acidithrix sp. C25]|uniref:Gfo/Idh/MocA family protein n=1 Tax=Acidithrix sp. C25 TaxID=1671482 RepID=UPI00191B9A3C|nr:Gfo/Idh/MocA family oxidoreductase [Acidithrix sp. C25]CAG4934449.1 unnamed protein product [Acidithrix sp. C25]